MIINELNTFLCIADCGSFGKAAEKLYISPTAVMKQMNYLESHLGLTLVNRTNQGITLTESGKSLYRDTKYILSFSEMAVSNAHKADVREEQYLRIGSSVMNPCKPFMDIWNRVSSQFPQYKVELVTFTDSHKNMMSVLENIGEKYDFVVAVCDSRRWLAMCNLKQIGTYKMCISVPSGHRLADKKMLSVSDLYGETLMMVKRGDSPANDAIRENLEKNHPQIHIEDAQTFYDIDVFNQCEKSGHVLLNLECWADIHPTLVTIPVDWDYRIPYGLLYPLNPSKAILDFLNCIDDYKSPKTKENIPE